MNETIWHHRALRGAVAVLIVVASLLGATAVQAQPTFTTGVLDLQRETIQVKIYVDGVNTVYDVPQGCTVEQAVKAAGIELGVLDIVNLPLSRRIEAGVQIDIERRARVIEKDITEIPFDVIEYETPLLADGYVKVLVEGKPGIEYKQYERYYIDGVVIEEKLLSEGTESQPSTQTVMVGTNTAKVSQMDFGYEFENGEPVGYQGVIRSGRAAGYTANPGAKTASGRDAIVGHVAVDPRVIPYGSKLYIRSTDGSFVYGYAIAADTGTSLMNGVIDVDLFYNTYTEAALNGMRSVDIYILEYPA